MANVDKNTGIWGMHIAKKRHKCDRLLTAAIANLFDPIRVADLGCGDGMYCRIFKTYGWPEVHGYEGTVGVKELGIYDDIMFLDLTKKRFVDIDYDLVVCLEVGEHIPPEHEQVFLDNLAAFSSKHLVLSWAVPGQYSASGHVNCQDPGYVIKQVCKRGFNWKQKQSQYLKDKAEFEWFKKAIMVFERRA